MHRRALLRGLPVPAFLAGCLSVPDGGTPAGGRRVSLAGIDDPPDLPVRPSVEVVAPGVTETSPPKLRVTVANTAGYPVEMGEEREVVFAFVHSREVPGVQLLPEPADDYPTVSPGCFRLAEPIAIPEYYGIVRLAPGESTARELGVWGSAGLERGCLPTGRFRLVATYSVGRDRTDDMDDLEESARWGFALEIA